MKKILFLIFINLLLTLSLYAREEANCNITSSSNISSFQWEEREICLNTYKTICEYDDTKVNFKKRGIEFIKSISDQAGEIVYQDNKIELNKNGITYIDESNFETVFYKYQMACLNDDISACKKNKLKYHTGLPQLYEMEIEEKVREEFFKLMAIKLDPKIDHLQEAFRLIQERMILILKEELTGKLPKKVIEEAIYRLRLTKGLFSSSDKSILLNFPHLRKHERQKVQQSYRLFCYDKLRSVHNAAYYQEKFYSTKYDITMYCPVDYLGGLEQADTINSVYRSLSFIVSHELGHQISNYIKNTGVFDKFNQCMSNYFNPDDLHGAPSSYQGEAWADFWAKKFLGKVLTDLKDYPVEEKILYLKESSAIFCDTADDFVHHSGEMRLNLAVRLTPEFRNAFRCSKHSDDMRLETPVNCGLDGAKFIMIPEL